MSQAAPFILAVDTPREIATIFKAILAIVFGGMSVLFWAVNRKEDARRIEQMRQLDAEAAKRPARQLPPLEQLRFDLSAALRCSDDLFKRGEILVDVANRMFALGDVSVSRPLAKRTDESGKRLEQIEGVIELDDNRYLVEIRWDDKAVGLSEIQKQIASLSSDENADVSGVLFVSFSGFTEQAIDAAKKAISADDLVMLSTLSDFVHVLEGEGNVDAFLSTRIQTALVDKNPYASYC
jgi:hypothetical protein